MVVGISGCYLQEIPEQNPAVTFLAQITQLSKALNQISQMLCLLLLPHPSVIHHAASFSQSNLNLSASCCLCVLQCGIARCIMFNCLSPLLDSELLRDGGNAHLVLQHIPGT